MKQTNNTATLFSLDEDFHQIIFKGCRNERSWSLISQMSTHLNRMRFLKMKSAISTWEKVLHEHGEIYRAIETGDVVRGQAGIAQNLDSDDIMFQRIIQQFASYFK
jgi:DNA-binding GntR family transcriptional regulator